MLKAEGCCGPLRRSSGRRDDDAEHDRDLTDVDLCWKHSPPHPPTHVSGTMRTAKFGEPSIEIKSRAISERDFDQARSSAEVADQDQHSIIECFNSA
ncbi:hypothetical protein ACVWZM_000280 [Bradyrhizobium sp. USDA 4501]